MPSKRRMELKEIPVKHEEVLPKDEEETPAPPVAETEVETPTVADEEKTSPSPPAITEEAPPVLQLPPPAVKTPAQPRVRARRPAVVDPERRKQRLANLLKANEARLNNQIRRQLERERQQKEAEEKRLTSIVEKLLKKHAVPHQRPASSRTASVKRRQTLDEEDDEEPQEYDADDGEDDVSDDEVVEVAPPMPKRIKTMNTLVTQPPKQPSIIEQHLAPSNRAQTYFRMIFDRDY